MVKYLLACSFPLIYFLSKVVIGIIEFRGVRNSWATDERNIDLTLREIFSSSFILVMLLKNTMTLLPLFINVARIYMYVLSPSQLFFLNM